MDDLDKEEKDGEVGENNEVGENENEHGEDEKQDCENGEDEDETDEDEKDEDESVTGGETRAERRAKARAENLK